MTPTNGQLKRSARNLLSGGWRIHVCITFCLLLLEMIGYFISGLYTGETTMSFVFGLAVTFILNVFLGLIYDGAALYFLKLSRNEPASFRDLGEAYRQQADRFLVVSLIRTGAATVIQLPLLMMRSLIPALLLTAALIVIGGYILISTAPASLMLFDHPELSAADALTGSLRIMKGQRRRLILLVLSFLPWVLLSLCTLGIGTLWVLPYFLTSFVFYYESLPHPSL